MTPVLNPTQRIDAIWGVLRARQSAGTHLDQEFRPAAEQMASDKEALRACGMTQAEIDAFFAPASGRKTTTKGTK